MRRSLHLGLLVAALVGCGPTGEKESPPNLCLEDSDCSGTKFCGFDDRYGAKRCLGSNAGGEGGSNGSGGHSGSSGDDSRCGSSPLNGKYLWEVNSCRSGAITPGDPETCTFQYRDEDGRIFLLHYNGLKLTSVNPASIFRLRPTS